MYKSTPIKMKLTLDEELEIKMFNINLCTRIELHTMYKIENGR
jgi:hypothetical protein